MSILIPVTKLRETPQLVAFYHPQPAYALHILILPRRAVSRMAALGSDHASLLVGVMQIVQSLVLELDLETRGYRLIVNGGAYQDLPQLHWHLVSGDPLK